MLIVGMKTVGPEVQDMMRTSNVMDVDSADQLNGLKKNTNISAKYKDYLQVQRYIQDGKTFCQYMKEKNRGDITPTGEDANRQRIDCASSPPNWKFKDRLIQPYWNSWEMCWRGLKARIKPDLGRDPFTAAEHRNHNVQKKNRLAELRGYVKSVRDTIREERDRLARLDEEANELAESISFTEGGVVAEDAAIGYGNAMSVSFAEFDKKLNHLQGELKKLH